MQFTTFSLATLSVIAASVVSAESAPFGIMNTRSGSEFHFTNWGYDSKGNVVISSLSKSATDFSSLHVEDNTAVKTSEGKYFVVNSDHSITLGDESAATKGFTIGEQEGALIPFNFNGQDGYVTCPNSDGEYVLYTQNPAKYNDKCSGLSSWAVGSEGDVPAFSGDSSAASEVEASTTLLGPTGYFNTSTAIATDIATTVITITSCADNKCTLYTTTCPITDIPTTTPAPAPAPPVTTSEVATTVVTITSCADNKCTLYTTTCPVTAIPTTTPIVNPTTPATSVTVLSSSVPEIQTLTGGAGVKAASSIGAFGALVLALIL